MLKEIVISAMINSKEILPQNREHLEPEIKNIFLCAIGQKAPLGTTQNRLVVKNQVPYRYTNSTLIPPTLHAREKRTN